MPIIPAFTIFFALVAEVTAGPFPRYLNTTTSPPPTAETADPFTSSVSVTPPGAAASSTPTVERYPTQSLELAETSLSDPGHSPARNSNVAHSTLPTISYQFSYDPFPLGSEAQSSTASNPLYETPTESIKASRSETFVPHTQATTTLTLYTTVPPYTSEDGAVRSTAWVANYTMVPSATRIIVTSETSSTSYEEASPETSLPSYVWYQEPAPVNSSSATRMQMWPSSIITRQSPDSAPISTTETTQAAGLFTFSPYSSTGPMEASSSTPFGYGGENQGGLWTISVYSPIQTADPKPTITTTEANHEQTAASESSTAKSEASSSAMEQSAPNYPHPEPSPQPYTSTSTTTTTYATPSPTSPSNEATPPAYPSASESTPTPSTLYSANTMLPDVVMGPSSTLSAEWEDMETSTSSSSATIPGITIVPVNPDAVTIWMTTTVTEAGMTTTVSV